MLPAPKDNDSAEGDEGCSLTPSGCTVAPCVEKALALPARKVWRKWSWGAILAATPLTHPRGRAHLHRWPHHSVLPRCAVSGRTWVTHWAGTLRERRELGHPQCGGEAGGLSGAHCMDKETEAGLLPACPPTCPQKPPLCPSQVCCPPPGPEGGCPRLLVPFHILPRGLYQLSPSRLASVSKAWELPDSMWVYCKRTQRPEHLWGQTQGVLSYWSGFPRWEKPTDKGAWQTTVHGVAESDRLSD